MHLWPFELIYIGCFHILRLYSSIEKLSYHICTSNETTSLETIYYHEKYVFVVLNSFQLVYHKNPLRLFRTRLNSGKTVISCDNAKLMLASKQQYIALLLKCSHEGQTWDSSFALLSIFKARCAAGGKFRKSAENALLDKSLANCLQSLCVNTAILYSGWRSYCGKLPTLTWKNVEKGSCVLCFLSALKIAAVLKVICVAVM